MSDPSQSKKRQRWRRGLSKLSLSSLMSSRSAITQRTDRDPPSSTDNASSCIAGSMQTGRTSSTFHTSVSPSEVDETIRSSLDTIAQVPTVDVADAAEPDRDDPLEVN
jgi:hypothetical protein